MSDVCLRSEIPTDNPEKDSVEAAIRSVLGELSGAWTAEVALSRAASWWLISVSRAGDGFQGSVFVNPEQQNAQDVMRLLASSVQHLR